MDMKYVIMSHHGVKDGSIQAEPVLLAGKKYTVDQHTMERWLNSAGDDEVEIIDTLIPNPKKVKTDAKKA